MKIKLIILIPLLLFLTGCYNYRELNDLGITTAIYIKKDKLYELTIEVLKTEKENSKEGDMPKPVIFKSSGTTIQEALRNTILKSPKRLYAHHMQVLIIDENLAKEGISDILDLFFRDPESRKQFFVVVSKDDEILETDSNLTDTNSKSMYERIIANKNFLGNIVPVTFTNLLSKYLNPNIEIILPSINIKDDEIVFNESAIFKKDKLIGYISNEDTIYLNLICGKIKDTVITSKDKNYITVEINEAKTKYKVEDNKIEIKLSLIGNISEINEQIDLINPNSINHIENIFEEEIKNNINNLNKKIFDYDTDIFGFQDIFYKYNKNFNGLKNITINISINMKLKYKGNGAYELYER